MWQSILTVLFLIALGIYPWNALCGEQPAPSFTASVIIPKHLPAEHTLRFATLEWPPYISQEIPDHGYVAQLLREAFQPAGYSIEIVYLPWKRAVRALSDPSFIGYLPEYFDATLSEKQCIFSEGFAGGPLVFVQKTGKALDYTSMDDLKNLHIGAVSGYVNFKEFDEAANLKKDFATDDLANIRKLLANRVDLIIGDAAVITYLYHKYVARNGVEIQALQPFLEDKPLHICFNPKNPATPAINALFSKRLAQLKASGRLTQLHHERISPYLPSAK